MDTARSKHRGAAFARGDSSGAPTSSRRISGRTTQDTFGGGATSITQRAGGVDPFGGGII